MKGWPKNKFAPFKIFDKVKIILTKRKNASIYALKDGSTEVKPIKKSSKKDIF